MSHQPAGDSFGQTRTLLGSLENPEGKTGLRPARMAILRFRLRAIDHLLLFLFFFVYYHEECIDLFGNQLVSTPILTTPIATNHRQAPSPSRMTSRSINISTRHETQATIGNMNSLPPEILVEILSHLPPSSHPPARLTSRLFNALLSPTTFPRLASFLDPAIATSLLEEGVREARARNVMSVWSPWCSVPRELPIPKSFLLAMYLALRSRQWVQGTALGTGESWESDSAISGLGDEETDAADEELTAKKMAGMLGRHDLGEDVVRGAMFWYALYLSYIYRGEGQAPSLWVFDKELWETKL